MAKTAKASGHISFRLPVESHGQLQEVARHLGLDLTALLNLIIHEALPGYLDKASKLARERARAGAALDEAVLSAHPLVQQLVEVGRGADTGKRLKALAEAAARHRREGDPPTDRLVQVALAALRDEDELGEIEKALGKSEAKAEEAGKAPLPHGRHRRSIIVD